MNCTYAVSCKNDERDSVSYCTQFDPSGNGQNLWNDLHKNGKLTEPVLDADLKGKIFHPMHMFASVVANHIS